MKKTIVAFTLLAVWLTALPAEAQQLRQRIRSGINRLQQQQQQRQQAEEQDAEEQEEDENDLLGIAAERAQTPAPTAVTAQPLTQRQTTASAAASSRPKKPYSQQPSTASTYETMAYQAELMQLLSDRKYVELEAKAKETIAALEKKQTYDERIVRCMLLANMSLANVYAMRGDMELVEKVTGKRVELCLDYFGELSDSTIRARHEHSTTYLMLGQIAKAEQLEKANLEALEKRLQMNDSKYPLRSAAILMADTLTYLTTLYRSQKRFDEMEKACLRTLEMDNFCIQKGFLKENSQGMGGVYSEFGYLYLEKEEYEKSLENFNESYKREVSFCKGKDHPFVAGAAMQQIRTYRAMGRLDIVEEKAKEALAVYTSGKEYAYNHPQMPTGTRRKVSAEFSIPPLLELAQVCLDTDRPSEAKGYIERCEEIIKKSTQSKDNFALLMYYNTVGNYYRYIGDYRGALRNYELGAELMENQRLNYQGMETSREAWLSNFYYIYEGMLATLHAMGETGRAYEIMEQTRARGLQDLMKTSSVDIFLGIPEHIATPLRQKIAKVGVELRILKAELMSLEYQYPNENQRKTQAAAIQRKIDAAQQRQMSAWSDMKIASPVYRMMLSEKQEGVPLETLRKDFDASKTVALEYLLGDERGYLLVFGHSVEPMLIPLELTETQAEALGVKPGTLTGKKLSRILQNKQGTGLLQQLLDMENAADTGQPDETSLQRLALLWEVLVPDAALREKLTDGATFANMLVLPDGSLARLPFEMLVTGRAADEPQYLLDSGPTVLYAPSVSMFHYLAGKEKSQAATVLTLGNPVYAETADDAANGALRSFTNYGSLKPLPATEMETNWVAKSCEENGIPVVQLKDKAATEKRFRESSPGAKLVHLACHGIADDSYGNMFGSLALTVGDAADAEDDGFLTLAEMFNLDLKGCELAVMSACDTNMGPHQHGEGTWSLSRGMLVSGARRVLTTNWSVDDEASAHLAFYFIDGVNKDASDHARSLREAKRQVRTDGDNPQWKHPYYWAPFVLIGPN